MRHRQLSRLTPSAALLILSVLSFPCSVSAEPAVVPSGGRAGAWVARALEHIKLPPKLKQAIDSRIMVVRGRCTQLGDRFERSLPPSLQPAFQRVRLFSPMAISAFAWLKLKKDPLFVAGFGVVSAVVNNLKAPLLMAMGMAPFPAFLIQELTGTPVTLGVLAWRQHHLRADRSQSFGTTVRGLLREYRDFAAARREQNRCFVAEREAARASTLGALGATLR